MPSWKKVIISGSDAELNSLNITTALTASGLIYPTTDGLPNQAIVTDGAGNLSFNNPYSDNTIVYGKNLSGTTIEKGTPLYFTGSGTAGNLVGVLPADAGNPARMPAGGVAGEQLLDEAEGVVLLDGFINGVNTSPFNSGDLVYVAVGGGYTNVRPTGSTGGLPNKVQELGYVEKVSDINGSGVIKGPGITNDIPNTYPGYVFVGDADWVATPIPTSSIQNVVSSSYATTASFAQTSSYVETAQTASYVLNAVSASYAEIFPYTGSAIVTGSLLITGGAEATTVQSNIFLSPQVITEQIIIPSGFNGLIVGNPSLSGSITVSSGSSVAITDFTNPTPNLQAVTDVGSTTTNSITAANFITTSDKRLKSEIKEIKNPFKVLGSIKSYEYIKDGKQDAGFIAQEVQETIPYAVFENEDGMLTMSDRPMLAYLYAAVMELKQENEKLKKELKNIKS